MNYSKFIDHTNLKQDASINDIKTLCEEAIKFDFMSVCINPCFVKYAHDVLLDSEVKVCTVIGFPLGANTTKTKVYETKQALKDGADEIDMVINVSALKDKKYDYVKNEISKIKKVCKNKILKVILEICLLTDEEIVKACELSLEAKADFVKTSTGFSKGGATVEAVALMRKTVGDKCGVKASGGVKTFEDMQKMIDAGASRIGTSSGVKLLEK